MKFKLILKLLLYSLKAKYNQKDARFRLIQRVFRLNFITLLLVLPLFFSCRPSFPTILPSRYDRFISVTYFVTHRIVSFRSQFDKISNKSTFDKNYIFILIYRLFVSGWIVIILNANGSKGAAATERAGDK